MKNGKVFIIGVGPGDYKLITLKALQCIENADVVVYDRLVGEKILSFAKRNAELINVGKKPDFHAVPQEGINEILVKKAKEGKNVARVKGGDPFVFGRGGEEAQYLWHHQIEFEIVPGVTSAVSVPAYAGIPVTHRDFCSSLHIITGHESPEKEESRIDYKALAMLSGTLVFLMGIKNIQEICKNLIQYGKDPKTPVAVVENGTTHRQRTVTGTLLDIHKAVLEEGIHSPAVTVIGPVVSLREKLQWFLKGKLSGKKVIVTRSREQASKLVEKIEAFGGEAIEFPTIRIEKIEDFTQLDRAMKGIRDYGWIVFTSVNGVKAFFERMQEIRADIRNLYGTKIAVVGEATESELNRYGLLADLVPQKFTTESLLSEMIHRVKPDEKVLLARADIATEDLSRGLKEAGVLVEDLTVYRTLMEDGRKQKIMDMLERNQIDFITFTSSSTVKNFVSLIGEDGVKKIKSAKAVCIGPVTSKTARELGIRGVEEAEIHTIGSVVQKLLDLV